MLGLSNSGQVFMMGQKMTAVMVLCLSGWRVGLFFQPIIPYVSSGRKILKCFLCMLAVWCQLGLVSASPFFPLGKHWDLCAPVVHEEIHCEFDIILVKTQTWVFLNVDQGCGLWTWNPYFSYAVRSADKQRLKMWQQEELQWNVDS